MPSRRHFLKQAGATVLFGAAASHLACQPAKTHYITLSFDDGFQQSSIKTAEIFEKHNLAACINVIASAHHADFVLPNPYHDYPVGDFGLWNELKERGHEIMPHGYQHTNLGQAPLDQAQSLVMRCLDYFTDNLRGFDPKKAVFNFPFNSSNPELEAWLSEQVMAFRTGAARINPLPHAGQQRLFCISYGPDNIDAHLKGEIDKFLAGPPGWFIYNTHGLDDEGWGPLSSSVLDALLGRLASMDSVAVVPTGMALTGAG